jgi:hypothetical protein
MKALRKLHISDEAMNVIGRNVQRPELIPQEGYLGLAASGKNNRFSAHADRYGLTVHMVRNIVRRHFLAQLEVII